MRIDATIKYRVTVAVNYAAAVLFGVLFTVGCSFSKFDDFSDKAPAAKIEQAGGISSASFYKYKAKFGGMEVSDARKLRALEDENARLKKLVADLSLDNAMLKDVNSRKW